MGLNSVTNFAIKYGDDFLNACAKTRGMVSKTFQKPASIYPEVIDQSLSPMFLQSLKNIEGDDTVSVIRKIKDLIMKAMGFKHPEQLEVLYNDYSKVALNARNVEAGFDPITGAILLGDRFFSKTVEDIIALLRHELDHVVKFTQVFKKLGADGFTKATTSRTINNCIIPIPYRISQEVLNARPNINFFENFAKQVDIGDFDSRKYIEAYIDVPKTYMTPKRQQFEYFNNALEQSAYKIQQQAIDNLGYKAITPDASLPKNYLKIVNSLEVQGVDNPYARDAIMDIITQVVARQKEPDAKILLQLLRKECQGIEMTPEEITYLTNKQWKIFSPEELQKLYKEVEDRIVAGKITLEDILAEIDDVLAK